MRHRVGNAGNRRLSGLSGQLTAVPVQVPLRAAVGDNPDPFRLSGSDLNRPVSRFLARVRRRIQEAQHFLSTQVAVLSRLQPGVLQKAYLNAP